MAHPCQAPHGHGIATSGVHMEIIVKFSEALPCVKSPVSRTAGTIYVVTCVENVLVRTSWKENVARIGEGRCGDDKGMASAAGE